MQKESKPKSNKKVKLLILIVIIALIGIIVVSLLVRNIIITRNAEEENYEKSETLTADNIKEGITIGGVTGTLTDPDTSDANATADDIMSGKIGYANGGRVTGSYGPLSKQVNANYSGCNEQTLSFACPFEPTYIVIIFNSTEYPAINNDLKKNFEAVCWANIDSMVYWTCKAGYLGSDSFTRTVIKKDDVKNYWSYSDGIVSVKTHASNIYWSTNNYRWFAFK